MSLPNASSNPNAHEAPQRRAVARRRRVSRPAVSVCIVNWNCREMLRVCLRSLDPFRQKLHPEIIVVDNGSTDGAPEMVRTEFPDVVLICNDDNKGFSRANNQAAQRARGRYLFFLNNDTEVTPGALRRLLAFARSHPEAGVVGPRLRDARGRTQLSCRDLPTVPALLHRTILLGWTGIFRRTYRRYRGREHDLSQTRPVEALMGAAMLMHRRTFFDCGGWDESFTFGGEDVELCARVGRRHPVVYHPDVAIRHHGRVSSRRNAAYAFSNTMIGTARALRQSGCSPAALLFYKTIVTLDTPLQWLGHALRYLWRRLRGRSRQAEKSRRHLQGLAQFLMRGLGAFWRA
jgi:GT2 family glycosyltransferase